MKKLLTIKQQDKRVRILEQARSPYASRINCQVFHKTLRNRVGENIASELENGIEITENNIEYWNDYRQYSSQTNNNPGYWNDYLGPNDNELLDQHDDGEYSVGDMVSAFDYLKYPYDILYVVVDGYYIGGVVTLLTNNMCTEEPKVQIDTVNKKVIYSKVHMLDDDIKFQSTTIQDKLKHNLKERILTALNITQYYYDIYKNKLPKKQIRKLIVQQLGMLKFNQGRGYYFAYCAKNNILLTHAITKFIGKDMTNFKDLKGQVLVKLYDKQLKQNKIAFAKIYFAKPSNPNKQFPKLACIAKFAPLDLIIGTGEYLDVVEKQIQTEIIKKYNIMQHNKHSYVFAYKLHNINGGKNFATMIINPNRLDILGKKISDNYKDAKGKEFRKEFLKGIRQNGEAYVKYWYKKPEIKTIKPKMSYFYLNKEWNWVIACGFYYDDLDNQLNIIKNSFIQQKNNMITKTITITIVLLLCIIVVAFILALKIDNTIKQYTLKM